jgi:hypothetical protein
VFDEDLETNILRFKVNVGVCVLPPVDLNSIYTGLKIDEFLLSKTFYDHTPEYYSTVDTKIQKILDIYLYSEHSKGEKKLKDLKQNKVSFLYYNNQTQIKGVISNTGIMSLDVYPSNPFDEKKTLSIVKEAIEHVTCKNNYSIIPSDIDVKFTHSTKYGFIPAQTFVEYQNKGEIVNNIVKYKMNNYDIMYSSNDYRLNFTVHGANTLESISEVKNLIIENIKELKSNLNIRKAVKSTTNENQCRISTLKGLLNLPKEDLYVRIFESSFNGIYKLVREYNYEQKTFYIECDKEIKEPFGKYILTNVGGKKVTLNKIRDAGITVVHNECEISRRPVLLTESDVLTGEEDIKEINGRKFRCNTPYLYHGMVGSSNCCFKTKQSEKQKITGETINEMRGKFEKTPLKSYTKMGKWRLKNLDEELKDLLNPSFVILSVADKPEDRTIIECLKSAYGSDIITKSIDNLSLFDFKKYFPLYEFEDWKGITTKSIDDILIIVSIYCKVIISVLVDTPVGFMVKCPFDTTFEKVFLIYGKKDSYYILLNNENYEHDQASVSNILGEIKVSCNLNNIKPVDSYTRIIKKQITDVNDMVVFIEINSGGYIPVMPSTINNSYPVISINSSGFVLLTPDSQYNSLKSISIEFPELEPISITKGLTSKLTTGIKLKNGGVCPVSHTNTEVNGLPTDDELFYLEIFSTPEEKYEDNEKIFTENLEKVKTLDQSSIQILTDSNDYSGLINLIKQIIPEQEQLSRVVWFIINNGNSFF